MSKIAYLFPGQGSQFPGMGKEFYEKYPEVREIYSNARNITGFDVAEISFESDKKTLAQTQYTQPCIYVHSFAVLSVLGGKAQFDGSAGHSLGEYTALAAAGVFSFDDGLAAVTERGKLMAEAKEGGMIAPLGAKLEDVQSVVNELKNEGVIEIANYNAPGQFIISGDKALMPGAAEILKERGVRKVIHLPVGGAFHSPLMADAQKEMGKVLDNIEFRVPKIDFYANVTGDKVENPEEIKTNLIQQLTHPVRWIDIVQSMVRDNFAIFYEIGPGKVLRGLTKRIADDVEAEGWEALI